MRFIPLHTFSFSRKIHFNAEDISRIEVNLNGSYITNITMHNGDLISVKETPEEIFELIMTADDI